MKRPVSLLASLGVSLGFLAACAAEAAGKDELSSVCQQRMRSAEKCACYVDNVEKALSAEQFAAVAHGAHENRTYSGADWVPNSVRRDQVVSAALDDATRTCFAA